MKGAAPGWLEKSVSPAVKIGLIVTPAPSGRTMAAAGVRNPTPGPVVERTCDVPAHPG
jgi:hypothetical protein